MAELIIITKVGGISDNPADQTDEHAAGYNVIEGIRDLVATEFPGNVAAGLAAVNCEVVWSPSAILPPSV